MLWLLRLLIVSLLLFYMYRGMKYFIGPKRKLQNAMQKGQFYLNDQPNNIRRNLLLTYKGFLFEGEKYVSSRENSAEVVSIFIWPHQGEAISKISKKDLNYIEHQLNKVYPNCKIDWKNTYL
ncbi:sigma-w pathway protein ysdB [Cytobacillus sp. Hz8]|uniref:sigma-w pathway protein ysdB n=1 Tax=Cytobacillus sp. Hz8 TaxID=3347168 RepID=UPI0035DB984C